MNILIYRYNSICEPDVINAFQELGHQVSSIDDEITNKRITPNQTIQLIHSALSKNHYDFVFSINFFPVIAEVCNIYHIRYICWTVDSPVLELYSYSLSKPWNRIFMFDSAQYQEFKPYNPDRIFYLPLACNVSAKHHTAVSASTTLINKYTHKVSFIGSLYSEKNPYIYLKHSSEYMKGYLDALMETQRKIYGTYFLDEMITDEIVDYFSKNLTKHYEFPEKTHADYKALISQFYMGSNVTVSDRTHLLKKLSENFPVEIYTFSDTSKLPKLHNCGSANSITEMPVIFHNSLINLNLTSRPIRTGIPLRVWDILGCEGFVLTNYQNDLFGYLTPGEHIDIFTSEEELLQKTAYYLEHPSVCKDIAHAGYEHVKKHHTYLLRCEEMLQAAFSI